MGLEILILTIHLVETTECALGQSSAFLRLGLWPSIMVES